jgi:hypothetical protein
LYKFLTPAAEATGRRAPTGFFAISISEYATTGCLCAYFRYRVPDIVVAHSMTKRKFHARLELFEVELIDGIVSDSFPARNF